jgi:regulator of RNase E activity RraA
MEKNKFCVKLAFSALMELPRQGNDLEQVALTGIV